MSNSVHSPMNIMDEFIEGAARCFFVCAYADFVEEPERDPESDDHVLNYAYPTPGCGGDWYDVAPERTPPAAYAFAGMLWARLEAMNKATAPCGVISLVEQAATADGVHTMDVEHFGRDCAMMALGTGVSWFDDSEEFPLEVPYMDCGSVDFDPAAYREGEV